MNAKSLGLIAIGSLFGVCVGILATKKYYEKKSDEEIAEIKRVYGYKSPDIREKPVKKHSERLENAKETVKDAQEAIKITNYSGYSAISNDKMNNKHNNNIKNEDENEEKTDPAELEHPVDDDSESDEPYQIEAEDAGYGRDCITTTYFVHNNVLAETNTGEAIDIAQSVGYDNIEKCLGVWENDPDEALYFRNEKIGIDYEVLMSDDNYNEVARALNGFDS